MLQNWRAGARARQSYRAMKTRQMFINHYSIIICDWSDHYQTLILTHLAPTRGFLILHAIIYQLQLPSIYFKGVGLVFGLLTTFFFNEKLVRSASY